MSTARTINQVAQLAAWDRLWRYLLAPLPEPDTQVTGQNGAPKTEPTTPDTANPDAAPSAATDEPG